MKKLHLNASLLAGLSVIAGTSLSFGGPLTPIEITYSDQATAQNNSFNPTNQLGRSWTLPGTKEDNETERTSTITAIASQVWDMEAFTLVGNSLSIVTGYNMSLGQDNWRPGDLFIKVGGRAPGYGINTAGTTTITNNIFPTSDPTGLKGYDYVIDLSYGTTGGLPASHKTSVYQLAENAIFDSVNYDQFNSNPWKLSSTQPTGAVTLITAVSPFTYITGQTAAQVNTITGVGGTTNYLSGGGANGNALNTATFNPNSTNAANLHNILTVDLSFLATVGVPNNTQVYFSYVMECGNDSLKGQYGGGFDRSPDAGASVLLIGLGLGALTLFGVSRRKM